MLLNGNLPFVVGWSGKIGQRVLWRSRFRQNSNKVQQRNWYRQKGNKINTRLS